MSLLIPSCPANDGSVFTTGGQQYTIRCGIDHYGGDLVRFGNVNTFNECIAKCSTTKDCINLTYHPYDQNCYLKQTIKPARNSPRNWAALLTSATVTDLTCPSADGVVYTTVSGARYQITCNKDSSAIDLGKFSTLSFKSCLNTCDKTKDCVTTVLKRGRCYLKGAGGALKNDNEGAVAQRLSSATTTTTTTVATTTTATTVPTTITTTSTTLSTTTSATTTTTTTAVATPGPCANNAPFTEVKTSASGNSYGICANTNFAGHIYLTTSAKSTDACASLCTSDPTCISATYSGSTCTLRYGTSPATVANSVTSIVRINPVGPCANGSSFSGIWTSVTLQKYGICKNTVIDSSATNLLSVPIVTTGDSDRSFQCATSCSALPTCVIGQLDGSFCSLKGSRGKSPTSSSSGTMLVYLPNYSA